MTELPAALKAFAAYKQFVVYKAVPSSTRPGKTDKFPCDFRTGAVVDAHNPQFWTDYQTAINAAASFGAGYGIGFVFTEADPFWFIDIDECLQADGTWSPIATALCGMFPGAAIEVSQSGTGLHIFGVGRPPAHACKNATYKLEFYHAGRFVALSGFHATGDAGVDCSYLLPTLVNTYFPHTGLSNDGEWSDGPVDEWNGPEDDDELLRRMLRSQSTSAAFGGRASFADLFNCNIEVLARNYPDPVRAYDESSADAALAQHLAFWTGKDCDRMQRLMSRSQLARDKWNREDYLPRTIIGACNRQFEVLTDKLVADVANVPASKSDSPKPEPIQGATFLNATDQINTFTGCVYIRESHRVLIPGGHILKPDQFRVAYGGYTFSMDISNEKVTRDPWEAFTQSQIIKSPRANQATFKPQRPPGEITEQGDQTYVNTFWPIEVPRKVGDASRFLRHLELLLPDQRDRTILLSYMAACVQYQGYKFQWAPLIQGVPGNGKTLLTRCVAEAVGRRYVHWPKASKLTKEFNAWMVGKVFYAVEDIYVPDQKREIIEELKPMITGGDGLEIEGKGVDQISADICGNFMLNCNNKSALPKKDDDRRYGIFFTAQQSVADLVKAGMTGDYFPKMYDWLRNEGYAIISELLHTFPIPDEFNPATSCQRAPVTTSTAEAIGQSLGGIEQEILESIAQGLPGFCGGFVSSIMLEKLLERIGANRRMSHTKRREMLNSMGYDLHPGLIDGRVNNAVTPDHGKPKLFVHKDSPAHALVGGAEIAHAYEDANKFIQRVPFELHK